jgi:hypothetical protein
MDQNTTRVSIRQAISEQIEQNPDPFGSKCEGVFDGSI